MYCCAYRAQYLSVISNRRLSSLPKRLLWAKPSPQSGSSSLAPHRHPSLPSTSDTCSSSFTLVCLYRPYYPSISGEMENCARTHRLHTAVGTTDRALTSISSLDAVTMAHFEGISTSGRVFVRCVALLPSIVYDRFLFGRYERTHLYPRRVVIWRPSRVRDSVARHHRPRIQRRAQETQRHSARRTAPHFQGTYSKGRRHSANLRCQI